jgi:pimeloyl-ACP methyl ester carboxylesterase
MTAIDVAYESHGPAHLPTVVLTGSLGTTMEMWYPQVAALSNHYRVVAYDTRGHGRSPVPPGPYDVDDLAADLERLLDRLEVSRAHVIGLSLGGLTVMRLAATKPDRVDSAAVLCTAARFAPARAWAERADLIEANGMKSVAQTVVARWFTDAHKRADPDLIAWPPVSPVQASARRKPSAVAWRVGWAWRPVSGTGERQTVTAMPTGTAERDRCFRTPTAPRPPPRPRRLAPVP